MFVCCECFVLSDRGLCDGLITRPKESYRLWCVVVCDLETQRMRRPWPTLGRSATKRKEKKWFQLFIGFHQRNHTIKIRNRQRQRATRVISQTLHTLGRWQQCH